MTATTYRSLDGHLAALRGGSPAPTPRPRGRRVTPAHRAGPCR
ncbi:MAG: hypothetical protein ACRDYZ_16530 [Acidimicrobiales bacterium]